MKTKKRKHQNLYMFIRAQLSAQFATLADFSLTYICFQWLGVYYLLATAIGTTVGGILNCLINYKWAFMTEDCKFKWVLFKYILVWAGSLAFNVSFLFVLVEFIKENLSSWPQLDGLYLMLSKVIVSCTIAVCWNYPLHRYFVFRDAKVHSWIKNKTLQRKRRKKRR